MTFCKQYLRRWFLIFTQRQVLPISLQDDLNKAHDDFMASAPEEATQLDMDTREVVRSGADKEALAIGDTAPDFTLPDQLGREVNSEDPRAKGPLMN